MEQIEVDPRNLRLSSARFEGADPLKLHRQLAEYGREIEGMPPIEVDRTSEGEYLIRDGVTQATRAAMVCPGARIAAIVRGQVPRHSQWYRRLEETLP